MGIKMEPVYAFKKPPRFYNKTGKIVEFVDNKPVTIKECRELGLYPSVHEILSTVYPSWGIYNYNLKQFADSVISFYKKSKKCNIDEVALKTIFKHKRKKEFKNLLYGSDLHEKMADIIHGKRSKTKLKNSIISFLSSVAVSNNCKIREATIGTLKVEKPIDPAILGFGGTPDIRSENRIVDWKFKVDSSVDNFYTDNLIQVTAYQLYNFYTSTNFKTCTEIPSKKRNENIKNAFLRYAKDGTTVVNIKLPCHVNSKTLKVEELNFYVKYFVSLFKLWCIRNKYTPKRTIKMEEVEWDIL